MSDDTAARLRHAFEALDQRKLAGLDDFAAIYHDDVYFEDPMQRLHGKPALLDAMRRLFARMRDLDLRLESVLVTGDEAYLTWTMRLHPRLGPSIHLEGVTHLRLSGDLVIYHRDYWDLLSSLAESSPLLGLAYRAVMKRLA